MIDFGAFLAVFGAELRLTRRLARYWVFLSISLLMTAFGFVFYSILHYFLSTQMPFMGTIAPRYIVSGIANNFILIFGLGLVFLAFDIRARDVRERMHEVLDARPIGNVEIVLGRAAAQVVAAWVPMMIALVVAWAIGSIFGEAILPRSIIGLGLVMGLPAFVFIVGFTYVVTLLVRHRLVAAVLVVGVLVGIVAALFFMTIQTAPAVDLNGGYMIEFPSELVRTIVDGEGILHRVAITLAGLGLLVLAAALYPRLDDGSRSLRAGIGAVLILVGVVGVGGVLAGRSFQRGAQSAWMAAHEAAGTGPGLDIRSISADVTLEPGRELSSRGTFVLANDSDAPLTPLVLTLNPGLVVTSAAGAGGAAIGHEQRDGLVILDAAIAPGATLDVELEWSGIPDMRFAYLDAPLDIFDIQIRDAGMFLLGYRPGFFHKSIVVLPPGVHWMPSAGAAFARGDERAPKRDFFELQMDVTVPGDWLVAAPGRRAGDAGRFRFQPGAPVPGAALVAGPFVSRSREIDGVLFEALLHPNHIGVLDDLEPARELLFEQVSSKLSAAAESGLRYPYDGFTLVEVPTTLRGWGGSWRMDTTLSPPAMFLMKENALPTARFDVFVKRFDPDESDQELDEALAESVLNYFVNDITGTNILAGATRNLLRYQVAARGHGAEVLDFAMERLAARLTSKRDEYFSIHVFDRDLSRNLQTAGFAQAGGGEDDAYAEAVLKTRTDSAEAWDALLSSAIADFDPWQEPARALDVLALKTSAMARSIRAELGRADTAAFLGRLIESHRGGSYDRDDIVAAAGERGEEIAELLEQWLDTAALAGFVVEKTAHVRLADTDEGAPRYQLELTIRNDESVPGLLQVAYAISGEKIDGSAPRTDPLRIAGRSALRVGIVSSRPFGEVLIEPYLSLNRGPFAVKLPALDEGELVRAEEFDGAEAVAWSPGEMTATVIDDLDEGFRVEAGQTKGKLRVGARRDADSEAADGRLPEIVFGRSPKEWSRSVSDEAWGRYRHTAAVLASPGDAARAVFETRISSAGRYRIDVHVPKSLSLGTFRELARGSWKIEVGTDGQLVLLDADDALAGWNVVGEFDLEPGPVEISIAAGEGAQVLIADAVRVAAVVRGESGKESK